MPTFDEQKRAAQARGGEDGLARWLGATRRQNEVEQTAARAAFAASPEGELRAIEEELAVAGAQLSPAEWQQVQRELGNDPAPPQPNEWQLPLYLRQRIHNERMAKLAKETDR